MTKQLNENSILNLKGIQSDQFFYSISNNSKIIIKVILFINLIYFALGLVRNWCRVVAWILNIHSYLLGNDDGKQNRNEQNGNPAPNAVEAGLGAVHQALLMMEPPQG